jgi:4-diphosphocytidyl-2-C-methyl-D-erythritol kinase
MKQLQCEAYAKINLTLDVLGKREDGYHELCMVMQSVSLADQITLSQGDAPDLSVTTNLGFLPGADKNLAGIAARAFAKHTGVSLAGLNIDLQKQIPVCAGTAGGSSDAAAVLRGLNRWFDQGLSREELAKLGEEVGSDVPYCVYGDTALAEGRGEVLTHLPSLPFCYLVLCKPNFSISTPELFHRIDEFKLRFHPDTPGMRQALEQGDLEGVSRRLFNVFEEVLPPQRRAVVEEIKSTLLCQGALGACMSGTGPTVFGLFRDKEQAQAACEQLAHTYPSTFLTHSVVAAQ